jgi:hypothetical protein
MSVAIYWSMLDWRDQQDWEGTARAALTAYLKHVAGRLESIVMDGEGNTTEEKRN